VIGKTMEERLSAFLKGIGMEADETENTILLSPDRLFGLGQTYAWEWSQLQHALAWLEEQFKLQVGEGPGHNVICEIHKGEKILSAILREINRERLEEEQLEFEKKYGNENG